MPGESGPDVATEVVVSVPSVDDRTVQSIASPSYESYLRRARAGRVVVGEEWEEFVNCGCGTTHDLRLRVEALAGGDAIGEDTQFVFEPREA
jgi:hypothetical protein